MSQVRVATTALIVWGMFALATADILHAQRTVTFDHPAAGDCELVLLLQGIPAGSRVGADVEFTRYAEVAVADKDARLKIQLAEPLDSGFRLQAHLNGRPLPAS